MKIAVVTNILTPYRMRFYGEMYKQLVERDGNFKVFVMTKKLPLRPWNYDTLKDSFTELLPGLKIMYHGQDELFNFSINNRLKRFAPDIIVIAGSWTYATCWQMLLNKLKGTKYFFWSESHTVRATPVASKAGFFAKIKKFFYMHCDGFCFPGKYANETLNSIVESYGMRVRLPNLVDNEYYSKAIEMRKDRSSLRSRYNLPLEKKIFITPARLIPIKGMDTFLKQIKDNNKKKDAVFVLAGEGPLEQTINHIAKENEMDVRILGYCNQDTVRELYALADFFLLPSLLDPNPLTVIEGSFSGLPLCISKYVGNSPELGVDKVNGVVYDTINKKSVNTAFNFVMEASDEWILNAGKNAYKIAKENFTCNKETARLLDYFESLI